MDCHRGVRRVVRAARIMGENMEEPTTVQTALYLTFKLGDEVFAVDVSQVREVLDWTPVTKVPCAPDFMRGVINVRGSVVPVVDMRAKFGLPAAEVTDEARIIVLELMLDGELAALGALADAVEEVVEIDADRIKPPPKIGSRWKTELIKGIGKRNETFVIILDVDRVFSVDELALVDGLAEQADGLDAEEGAEEKAD